MKQIEWLGNQLTTNNNFNTPNKSDGIDLRLATKAICNGWVKYEYKVLSSLLRLVTVDRYVFRSQPLQNSQTLAVIVRYSQITNTE